jgi:DNA-binding MarR family transcriptional regulator
MNKRQSNPKSDDALNMALCTCANIRKAARMVTQMYETALQQTGLKVGQVTMLAVLSNRGDMPLTSLADALVMDRTTLTRNLKPMVRDGLVSVETEEDQRVRMVGLTGKGRKKIKQAYPLWAEVQSRLVDGLGSERWSGLVADLNATVEVARKG